MTLRRAGFTLLEVVIALAILAVSLVVLIETQSAAVLMTVDTEKVLTGTYLAQEKMNEAVLRVERDGFSEGDIDEEGDFEDWGSDGGFGQDVEFGDAFEEYRWAYTIRKVDLQLGDMSSAADQLSEAGLGPKTGDADGDGEPDQPEQRDLGDLGVDGSMFTEMLRPYIREVRVLVWWSEDEPDLDEGCEACVELVTHVINPSGTILPPVGG
jgi:general secretion pathway protein I